jgi:phage terminase large subunit-like protein
MPADPRQTQHPKGYWFDQEAGERVVTFIEKYCRHTKGEWAGTLIEFEPWQRQVHMAAFGWRRPDGSRRYRILYIEIPRKNAKSTTAAADGLYLLVGDQEPGAEVYSSATKKDQARIVHDAATQMVKASPELGKWVKAYRNNLSCGRLNAKFEPLGADSNTLDGLNPHGNIVDELHAHRDRGVWDVLDTAMGARRQPMTIAITTAGIYEPESIGWQMHEHATNVLEGVLEDDGFFAFIAAADEGDDWTDPETWRKANPNIDVSIREEYLSQQCEKAKAQPAFLNTFLRLHLNRWTQQRDRWISMEHWNASDPESLSRADAAAREASWRGKVAFGGLDLSSKIDITTLQLLVPLERGMVGLVSRFWCPEATIMERSMRDRVPYDAWVRDGWLTSTPGNVVDYDFIEAEAKALMQSFQLRELGFDPWNATQTATHLTDAGLTMVEVRQGYRSLSEPSKELEKLVMARKVLHGGHPILRWMANNVTKTEDPGGNIKPDKSTSSGKIDGIVAMIIALSG